MKYHFWLRLRDICREGDGEGVADSGNDGTDDAAGTGGGTGGPPAKTFTQDEVNALLAKERRAAQTKIQDQLKALEAIKQDGLTPEAKIALEQQIETLRTQSQTEAELAKQSLAKAQRDWKKREAELTAELDRAVQLHEKLQVDTVLSSAMGLHGVSPAAAPILSAFISQRLQKVPVMDEAGKATGQFRHMVNLEVPDGDDGKLKVLQLPPDKAVAHLRENETFAGLFISNAKPGIGGQNTPFSGTADVAQMTQEQYMQWRKQNLASASRR